MRRNNQRGITLVETLVALAVMGFVIAALLALIGQNTRFVSTIENRHLGMIAADNLMVEAMVLPTALELGVEEGETTVGSIPLRYRRTTIESGVEGVFRLEIAIMPKDSDQVIARATSMRRVP